MIKAVGKKNINHVGRFFACEKCGEVFERRDKSEHKCHVNLSEWFNLTFNFSSPKEFKEAGLQILNEFDAS